MKLAFWKMHGAGNDFILVDGRSAAGFPSDPAVVAKSCDRKRGVGADGLIVIGPSATADVRIRFFNADGSEAEMCGNGARCAALLAFELGLAKREMLIETGAGIVGAEVASGLVRVKMPRPTGWRLGQSLEVGGSSVSYHFVNTGVPHAVTEVSDFAKVDVQTVGSAVRRHPAFAPAGTNVDFMLVSGTKTLCMRTFERGVEAETSACGTGAAACALIAGRLGKVVPPVSVRCTSGDILDVDYRMTDDGAEAVSLTGPACHVFQGTIEVG